MPSGNPVIHFLASSAVTALNLGSSALASALAGFANVTVIFWLVSNDSPIFPVTSTVVAVAVAPLNSFFKTSVVVPNSLPP